MGGQKKGSGDLCRQLIAACHPLGPSSASSEAQAHTQPLPSTLFLLPTDAPHHHPARRFYDGIYVLYTYSAKPSTSQLVQKTLSTPESGSELNILRHMTFRI